MGTLVSPLGNIKGRVGNLVFRNINGKVFITRRPIKRSPPTEQMVNWHNRFALITKIASAINRNPLLKVFWGKSSFNKIVKENINRADPTTPNYHPNMLPGYGFCVEDAKLNISDRGIKIAIGALGTLPDIDTKIEKSIIATGIIIFKNPTDVNSGILEAIEVKSDPQAIDLNKPMNFEIVLYGDNRTRYYTFKTSKVIISLVTVCANGSPIRFSEPLMAEN